jgi:predicted Rossmann-fold nucleotide-binding protein
MNKNIANSAASDCGVHNICVYCGSGQGADPAYAEAARTLGAGLAASDIGLVYGGGGLGLMAAASPVSSRPSCRKRSGCSKRSTS